MSSLCPASYNVVALRDDDLAKLRINDQLLSQDEIFVQRRVDINISCKFVFSSPGNPSCKLDVAAWGDGLCGSCSFCNLLADSMQQSVETDLWNTGNLREKFDPNGKLKAFEEPVSVHFTKLEYRRDHAPETFSNIVIRRENNYRDVYLLLLRGNVLLLPLNGQESEDSKKIDVDLSFELFGAEDDPIAQLLKLHRRPIHGPRLSENNLEKMRHWIKNCDESHDRCFPKMKDLDYDSALEVTAFLPTRMIEVGDTANGIHPRLIITSEMQKDRPKKLAMKYMALSYCWGREGEMLTTTQQTLPSRTENIMFDTMPRAFQDALIISQALSIPYLWIDSLCILQDDARDWQIESSRMADIFSNAYLTVVAAVGSSCHDSFLDPAPLGPTCTIPLTLNLGRRVEGQFSLRFRTRRGTSDKMADIIRSKWISRGWTFQEERLAQRVLIFGETKFFLDCKTYEQSQDTERREIRPNWATSVGGDDSGAQRKGTETTIHWGSWRAICKHYSFRELTYPEDKLPAISGMAHRIFNNVQSEYLAGLWRDNLMHDLFWKTETIASKPERYRAPSWSWASLDGKISWPSSRVFDSCVQCTSYCTILDAHTTHVGLDPYGAVKDAFLKVRGVLEQMTVVWLGGERPRHPWRLLHKEQEIGLVNLDMQPDHLQEQGLEFQYYALIVSKCDSPMENRARARGLLMEKKNCTRDGYDEFTRVGTFALFADVGPDQNQSLSVWGKAEQEIMIV